MAQQNLHINLSDEELMARYRASGDSGWLGNLLQRYTALLLGVSLKYLKEKSHAEDAVQQVFEKALTRLPKEEMQNFKGWLYILTRNHCLQQLRDQHHNIAETSLEYLHDIPTDNDEIKWQEYTLQQMEYALDELSPEQRQCITLFYLEKCSYEQIIDKTNYTFMQVKSYIQNGKRNLKNILLKKLGHSRP